MIEVQKLKAELQTKNTKRIEEEQNIIQNAKIQARNILLDAKEEANEIIKNMQTIKEQTINTWQMQAEQQAGDSNANRKLNELRNKLNSAIKQNSQNAKTQVTESQTLEGLQQKIVKMQPDTKVWSKELQKEGIVVSHVSKDNQVVVQFGSIKMSLTVANLEIRDNVTNKQQNQTTVSIKTISKTRTAKTEINVIGLNVEEAIFVVDKFLDDSSLAKLPQVRIVHGKGTGKLRNGIHQFLKKNQHVKSFRLGTFGEGEMGVTVVELQ